MQPQPHSILLSTRPELEGGSKQRGYWEKIVGMKERLLCGECEEKFSKLELSFREFFYGKTPGPLKKSYQHKNLQLSFDPKRVRGLIDVVGLRPDYRQLKLFALSLVWRSSIASGSFFGSVKLGASHDERIGIRLLSGDPGPETEYPVYFLDFRNGENGCEDMIEQPMTIKADNQRVVSIKLGGFLIAVRVSELGYVPDRSFSLFSLKQNEELILARVEAGPFFRDIAASLVAMGRL